MIAIPPVVAPPLGDVVHHLEATIRRLEQSIANQGEELARERLHTTSLVARIHAVEQAIKELEAKGKGSATWR